jgi:outer membrane immunogenic protein
VKTQILAAALLLGSSTYALAADPGLPMEEAPVGFNWTGGYVGVQVGYGWGDSYYENSYGDFANYDPDGVLGGLYAGYNHQLSNNVVLGVDADLSWSGMDGDEPFYYEGDLDPDYRSTSDIEWSGALRARLGYAFDRFLPYIAGGVSFARYEFGLYENGVEQFTQKNTWTGWNIGAGVDYAFTDNILFRAEYRYTDFGSKDFGDLWDGEAWTDVDLDTHDIRIGIAYKF